MQSPIDIDLRKVIGRGYGEFWHTKKRYRVVMGGRGSKKSTTAALSLIFNMVNAFESNGLKPCALVIRKRHNTHSSSTFNQLKWAINSLGISHKWKSIKSPLTFTYIPSGQTIIFRGMDEPENVTSMISGVGHLCWVWWEEAYQISSMDDFNKIDLSIRGDLPKPLYKQHTLTFNPWLNTSWLKPRFFDFPSDNVFTCVRNYTDNEFLGDDDLELFEEMRIKNPKRYLVEGLGHWGVSEGVVFENWRVESFDLNHLKMAARINGDVTADKYGIDFGFTNHPSAFIDTFVNLTEKVIYVNNEIYKTKMLYDAIVKAVSSLGHQNDTITADGAEPRTIAELKRAGLVGIRGAKKGPDSIVAGIVKLQGFEIVVHPRCKNTIMELSSYIWATDKATGAALNKPVDANNHLMDALRYATEDIGADNFSWARA